MSEGLIRLAWTVAPSGYEIMTRDDLCHGRPLSVRAPNGQVYTWHWREVGVGLDLTKYRDSDEFIVPLIIRTFAGVAPTRNIKLGFWREGSFEN